MRKSRKGEHVEKLKSTLEKISGCGIKRDVTNGLCCALVCAEAESLYQFGELGFDKRLVRLLSFRLLSSKGWDDQSDA